MPIQTYLYLISILLAFLSSLIVFRLDTPFHLRMFSCLLGLTMLVETAAALMAYKIHISNNGLYNSFTLVEFCAYAWFFRLALPGPKLRWLFAGFFVFFPIFWLVTVFFVFGFQVWNSYVIIAGSFFTVLFCFLYYIRKLNDHEIPKLRTVPEFWIATGMLIYYMAALPYFGSLNFLIQYHVNVAKNLLVVLQCLGIVMYLTFTLGFIWKIRNTKRS